LLVGVDSLGLFLGGLVQFVRSSPLLHLLSLARLQHLLLWLGSFRSAHVRINSGGDLGSALGLHSLSRSSSHRLRISRLLQPRTNLFGAHRLVSNSQRIGRDSSKLARLYRRLRGSLVAVSALARQQVISLFGDGQLGSYL